MAVLLRFLVILQFKDECDSLLVLLFETAAKWWHVFIAVRLFAEFSLSHVHCVVYAL
jgi:hypothetical protein